MLFSLIEHCVGLRGVALDWFNCILQIGVFQSTRVNITRVMLFCPVEFPRVLFCLLCLFLSICSLLARSLENTGCHFTVMRMALRFTCLLNTILWVLCLLWHVWRMWRLGLHSIKKTNHEKKTEIIVLARLNFQIPRNWIWILCLKSWVI